MMNGALYTFICYYNGSVVNGYDRLQVLIDRDSMVMKNLEVGHLVFSRCGKVMKFLLIIDDLVPS